MEYFSGGTNTEIKKLPYILIERIEEDIIISSVNLVEVSRYFLDTSQDKMCGMEMVYV